MIYQALYALFRTTYNKNQIYKQNEIVWLSVLQGFVMFLVILGHVIHNTALFEWEYVLQNIIYSFHMSLFMCISGYLLYKTQIIKNKSFATVLKNKSIRLLIPYFTLPFVAFILKMIFSEYMKRPVTFSFDQLLATFVWLTNNPLDEMWFLNVLFGLFLLYPIYCIISKKMVFALLLLLFFTLIHFATFEINSFIFNFNRIFHYGIFFYVGILLAKYDLFDRIRFNLLWIIIIGCLLHSFTFYFYGGNIFTAFFGITVSFAFAIKISKVFPNLFSSFRDYTYQIFFIGVFCQVLLRILIKKIGIEDGFGYILFYVVSILTGIYVPVIVSKIVQKLNLKVLKLMIGLR